MQAFIPGVRQLSVLPPAYDLIEFKNHPTLRFVVLDGVRFIENKAVESNLEQGP